MIYFKDLQKGKLKVKLHKIIKCDQCQEYFEGKSALKNHSWSSHGLIKRKGLKCGVCFKILENKKILMKHLKSVHKNYQHHKQLKNEKSDDKTKKYKCKQWTINF